jgi:hypothetical protein
MQFLLPLPRPINWKSYPGSACICWDYIIARSARSGVPADEDVIKPYVGSRVKDTDQGGQGNHAEAQPAGHRQLEPFISSIEGHFFQQWSKRHYPHSCHISHKLTGRFPKKLAGLNLFGKQHHCSTQEPSLAFVLI